MRIDFFYRPLFKIDGIGAIFDFFRHFIDGDFRFAAVKGNRSAHAITRSALAFQAVINLRADFQIKRTFVVGHQKFIPIPVSGLRRDRVERGQKADFQFRFPIRFVHADVVDAVLPFQCRFLRQSQRNDRLFFFRSGVWRRNRLRKNGRGRRRQRQIRRNGRRNGNPTPRTSAPKTKASDSFRRRHKEVNSAFRSSRIFFSFRTPLFFGKSLSAFFGDRNDFPFSIALIIAFFLLSRLSFSLPFFDFSCNGEKL